MLFNSSFFSLNNIQNNKKGNDVQCSLIRIKLRKNIFHFLTLIVLLGIYLITYMSDTFCFTKLFKGYAVIWEMPTLICKSLTLCLYAVLDIYCFIYIISHNTMSVWEGISLKNVFFTIKEQDSRKYLKIRRCSGPRNAFISWKHSVLTITDLCRAL